MQKKLCTLSMMVSLGLLGSFQASAQVTAGTYQFINLGTAGSHAQDTGGKGTMTIASTGAISGSIYSYNYRTTTTFNGSVNLKTGVGNIAASDGKTYQISGKVSTKTYLDCSYTKNGSSSGSRGILWGIR